MRLLVCLALSSGCRHPVVEMDPARVPGAGAAVGVIVPRGTLVEPTGDGLRRLPVPGPTRALLHENGQLLGELDDGTAFFARLQDGRPYAWVRAGVEIPIGVGVRAAEVLAPAPVPVVEVLGERVRVLLPFEDADGAPLWGWVDAHHLTTERPDPLPPRRWVGIGGELDHDVSMTLVSRSGDPFARTRCGSVVRRGTGHVELVRDGIRIGGLAGPEEPCPASPEAGFTELPDGWEATTRTGDELRALADAAFAQGAALYTAESGRCVRWQVEGDEMVRRWEDETVRYDQAIRLNRRRDGTALEFRRGAVHSDRKVPLTNGIGTVGGDPIVLCSPPPAIVVDGDEREVRMVRAIVEGLPLLAWPSDALQERVFRSLGACLEHVGGPIVAGGRLPGWGCG